MPRAQGCAGAAIARLAALVPKPRVNLTRFHGVFAPNSKHCVHVTSAKREKGRKETAQNQPWDEKTPAERHASMTWMQRLKRVFNIDIETCEKCKGPVKIIACIEDPAVIAKILKHLKREGCHRQQCPAATRTSAPADRIVRFHLKICTETCCQGRSRAFMRSRHSCIHAQQSGGTGVGLKFNSAQKRGCSGSVDYPVGRL